MNAPKLICIIGAECTGKTTLAAALAAHHSSDWVPEYLRAFCDQHQRTPTPAEQHHILETQLQLETTALAHAQDQGKAYVFCDTAPLLTAVYSQFVFGDLALYDRARAAHQRYALTLLMEPDIPWVADGLQRDSPQVRPTIHQLLARELRELRAPTVALWGHGESRTTRAVQALQTLELATASAA